MSDLEERLEELHQTLDVIAHRLHTNEDATGAVLDQVVAGHKTLQVQLKQMARDQAGLQEEMKKLGTDVAEFEARHRRDLERLTAQVKLVDVRAEIHRKYGPYDDVRRTMRGILDVWDSGLTHDATLQFIAEKTGIDAPGYWLAAVLNATVSWIRKDQVTMESALTKAMGSHISKTALFAGLLNARYRRFEATESWLRLYLRKQDPLHLADEFVVVLDSAMLGVLGPATREQISDKCMAWFDRLTSQPELVEAQVDRWEKFIVRRAQRDTGYEDDFFRNYRALTEVSADWRTIARDLHQATAFGLAGQILEPLGNEQETDPEQLLSGIDQVLRRLSDLPEPGERQLRSREFDLQRAADPDDDEQTLADLLEAHAAMNEPTTSFLDLITNLVMHPLRDVSPRTTQLAMHLAGDWIGQALINLRARSTAAMPQTIAATINNWHSDIGPEIDQDEATALLAAKMDENTDYDQLKERRIMQRVGLFGLAAAAAAVWLLSISTGTGPGTYHALVPLGLFVACGFVATGIHLDTPRRLRAIREQGAQRKANALAALRAASAAHAELLRRWKTLLEEATELQERVSAVPPPVFVEDATGISAWPDDAKSDTLAHRQRQAPALLPPWDLKPEGW